MSLPAIKSRKAKIKSTMKNKLPSRVVGRKANSRKSTLNQKKNF